MAIGVLRARGQSQRAIARQLGIDEKAVRYRLARLKSGAVDGRARKPRAADGYQEAIESWLSSTPAQRGANWRALYEWLVREHGYAGSYKSVQRYARAKLPQPALRVRRRVETPPGAQAQVDWAEFPGVRIAGSRLELHAFQLVLSHSRKEAIVWSEREDLLAWLGVHREALLRICGVPAVIRHDNVKTAVARGAGAWGVPTAAYRAFARDLRFWIDATRPRAPRDKGKVERRVLAHRLRFDPRDREWTSVAELQAQSDASVNESEQRRICPATGLSVQASFAAEQPFLGPLPEIWPEPFDLVQHRRVAIDATVSFEGRSYSVPFGWTHLEVEVRGCARTVEIWAEGHRIAEHPRHTRAKLVLDPAHYEGESTERVAAPTPLGRMGKRLQELWALTPEKRPIDLYAALAQVAR